MQNPGLHVCYSRSLDSLCERLTAILRDPLGDPLEPEWVVVQSAAVIRWLSLELARRLGICANIEFLLPNRLVRKIAGSLFPRKAEEIRQSEREVLCWKIFGSLRGLEERAGFEPLRSYVQSGSAEMRRWQLAEQIAGLFDQYPIYRPDWIERWEAGEGEGWQPLLWREVAAGTFHPARMLREIERAAAGAVLPSRVVVFGTSSLPRFHVQLLWALSRKSEVTFLVNRPASGSWGDQPTRREAERARRRAIEQGQDPDFLYLEIGNRLVASLGKSGRDFASVLEEIDWVSEDEIAEPPEGDTLLRRLQRQIYEQEEPPGTPEEIEEPDLSLQVHGCHSEMRELEALQDYLIECFERLPGLKPSDIVVMAPNLNAYRSLIPAVFAQERSEVAGIPHLPYAIADRASTDEFDTVQVYLWLWELADSRFTARDVLRIAGSRPVRTRFKLTLEEIELVRSWISDTRIRWGLDAEQRAQLGFPGLEGNTWRDGLDRLLLGYAMAQEGAELFDGILPYDAMEGTDAETLSKFLELFEQIQIVTGMLSGSRTPEEWQEIVPGPLDRLFDSGEETQGGLRILRWAINETFAEVKLADASVPIESTVMVRALSRKLAAPGGASGYLSGGVTFCELRPLRSVPFRVICVLGMNDTAFPRQDRRPRFDLMRESPRKGDRSVREDDRYLFLETIMAAGDALYLSYLSRSVKDNSELPASIVVTELLDYIGKHFRGKGAGGALEVSHRLHGFHPDYFTAEPPLFSYSQERCKSALALHGAKQPRRKAFTADFPEPEGEAWKNLTLDRYLRFFRDPCRALVRDRLGISLATDSDKEPDAEPFAANPLDQYQLRTEMVFGKLDRNTAPADLEPYAKALGVLPPGGPGSGEFDQIRQDAEAFLERVQPFLAATQTEDRDIQVEFDGIRIAGRLRQFVDGRQIQFRCGLVRPEDRIAGWIRHLLAGFAIKPMETMVIGEDMTASYSPLDPKSYEPILRRLANLYREGMRKPLPFLGELSLKYLEEKRKGSDIDPEEWSGKFSEMRKREYARQCFGPGIVADPQFDLVASIICGAMLEAETLRKWKD